MRLYKKFFFSFGSVMATLTTSNAEMDDIMKIVDLWIWLNDNRCWRNNQRRSKRKKVGLLSVLLGALCASSLGNYLQVKE